MGTFTINDSNACFESLEDCWFPNCKFSVCPAPVLQINIFILLSYHKWMINAWCCFFATIKFWWQLWRESGYLWALSWVRFSLALELIAISMWFNLSLITCVIFWLSSIANTLRMKYFLVTFSLYYRREWCFHFFVMQGSLWNP